ncbi:MAG TPA: lytic transglycosylase domain-containing protein [Candidatus Binatia bacterium]|nr:lytic transglycosylase domain-containing protein [Candidatus Binatia bacterium]
MSTAEEGDNSLNCVTTAARSAGLVGLLIALAGPSASAREVRLPLTIEPTVIREALLRSIFNDPEQRAVFWGQPGECSFFYLRDPKVEGDVGRLRVVARGEARLGTDLGATCLSPIAWGGSLEVFERPRVDGWQLRFEVVDSNLYNEQGEKTLLVGQLWDRIKESVQPRFSAVTIDLGGPFRDLKEFLSMIVAPSGAPEAARHAIDSLHPVSVDALPKGIVVVAAFEVGEAPGTPAPSPTEGPLTEAEIDAFTARANQWDAFLTFVIKSLGERTLSKPARQALLETLIDARYQIAEALAAPSRKEDPVRQLFLKSWDRLRPVAEDIARGLPGADAVAVVTFIAAGDALAALDQAGPAFGIEISADGLRRMARMIAPSATGDPLEYSADVDPALRRMLGFGPPPSDADANVPAPEPTSWWHAVPRLSFGTLLEVASAWAETPVDHSNDWKGWVVEEEQDIPAYLKRVEELLTARASTIAAREKLSQAGTELFDKLLLATAWQETCWRQFRVLKGTVTYMRSSHGSVGMLQVNERVWRGFYEVEKLRWKVAYNVEAGAEVLLHYLQAAEEERGEGATPASPEVTARMVYAAYNGGPGQMRRYIDPKRRGQALARVVDQLFGKKFAAIDGGVTAQVASCLGGGSA